jgi:hypothetical protein
MSAMGGKRTLAKSGPRGGFDDLVGATFQISLPTNAATISQKPVPALQSHLIAHPRLAVDFLPADMSRYRHFQRVWGARR